MANAIRCAGLAVQKGERIQAILTTLLQERGEISLEHLRDMSEAEIKAELGRFKGVGPKTVSRPSTSISTVRSAVLFSRLLILFLLLCLTTLRWHASSCSIFSVMSFQLTPM